MNVGNGRLFETERGKGRKIYRVFAATVFVSVVWIWVYRATLMAPASGRWFWIGSFAAELWFGLYWMLTQSVRWNPTHRRTFKQRLTQRSTFYFSYCCSWFSIFNSYILWKINNLAVFFSLIFYYYS